MLQSGDTLVVEDLDASDGLAILVDGSGNRYELHLDECYSQRCSEAQAVCHRLIEFAAVQFGRPTKAIRRLVREARKAVLY